MNSNRHQTVSEYLADVPADKRRELERVRALVMSIVPDAVESISYTMPAFKYNGKPLLYYAAFKDHLSLFPTAGPVETLKQELAGFKTSKGAITFTLEQPLSNSLIQKIITCRLSEIM